MLITKEEKPSFFESAMAFVITGITKRLTPQQTEGADPAEGADLVVK